MKPRRFLIPVATFVFTAAHLGSVNATSFNEVEIGSGNTVPTGSKSLAVGADNDLTSGSQSGIFGESNEIAGGDSLVGGYFNTVDSGTWGGAIFGNSNGLWNSDSVVLLGGSNAATSESQSVLAGGSNIITHGSGHGGVANILLGELNQLSTVGTSNTNVQGTVLIGVDNRADSTNAWTFGQGNIAQSYTVTLGTYNATVSNASLIVGNGTGTSARSNALVVMKNGDVVVPGTLSVGGSAAVTTNYLSNNNYLTKGSGASSGAVLAVGPGSVANGNRSIAFGQYSLAAC